MRDEHVTRNRLIIEWLGAIACACALAFVQWVLNKDSVEQPESRTLIKYILIDLACFSVALLVVSRFISERLVRCSAMALLGAVSAALFIDVPFFYKDIPNWRGDTVGWLMHAASFVLLNGVIALLVMFLVYGAGIVIRANTD